MVSVRAMLTDLLRHCGTTVVVLATTLPLTQNVLADDPYYLVCSGQTSSVLKYDVDGNFLGDFIPSGTAGLQYPNGMAIGPDGVLYLSGYSDATIYRFNLETGDYLGNDLNTGTEFGNVGHLRMRANGELIASSLSNNKVLRYDVEADEFLGSLIVPNPSPHGLLISDDDEVLVASWFGNRVSRYDENTGSFIEVATQGSAPHTMMQWSPATPDQSKFLTLVGDGTVREYDTASGDLLRILINPPFGQRGSEGLGVSIDNTIFWCFVQRNEIREYDATTGEEIRVFADANSGCVSPVMMILVEPDRPRLWVDSDCDGVGGKAKIRWTNATPNGNVALLYGEKRGTMSVPNQFVCPGVQLGLGAQGIRIAFLGKTGDTGERTLITNIPAKYCGGFVQLVDIARCTTSETRKLK